MGETRSHRHEVEIAAPVTAVWRALTEAEELTKWYVEQASVDPREGGDYWVSWGEGMDGHGRIDVWEPNRRLRLVYVKPDEPDPNLVMDLDDPIVEDYTLEDRGGSTILRLVHDRIPASAEWDAFYDGTNVGWEAYFQLLRFYLERHAGKPKAAVTVAVSTPQPLDEAWQTLMGPSGLTAEGTLDGLRRGDKYAITTAAGEQLHGEVITLDRPSVFTLSVEEYGDALIGGFLQGAGNTTYLNAGLTCYGVPQATVDEIGARWTTWLQGLFS
jgi:uncharacterized protein YndB with AHSA1/START domain